MPAPAREVHLALRETLDPRTVETVELEEREGILLRVTRCKAAPVQRGATKERTVGP